MCSPQALRGPGAEPRFGLLPQPVALLGETLRDALLDAPLPPQFRPAGHALFQSHPHLLQCQFRRRRRRRLLRGLHAAKQDPQPVHEGAPQLVRVRPADEVRKRPGHPRQVRWRAALLQQCHRLRQFARIVRPGVALVNRSGSRSRAPLPWRLVGISLVDLCANAQPGVGHPPVACASAAKTQAYAQWTLTAELPRPKASRATRRSRARREATPAASGAGSLAARTPPPLGNSQSRIDQRRSSPAP